MAIVLCNFDAKIYDFFETSKFHAYISHIEVLQHVYEGKF